MSVHTGKDTPAGQAANEKLPSAGDVKNDTARLLIEKQPESEEARPVAGRRRAIKNGG